MVVYISLYLIKLLKILNIIGKNYKYLYKLVLLHIHVNHKYLLY
jgi:hypothetical protein